MQSHSAQGCWIRRIGRAARSVAGALCVLAMGVAPLGAQNVCVKTIGSASPTLDGVVASGSATVGCAVDAVWNGVSAVEFWAGGMPSGGQSPGGYMYLALRQPPGPNNDRLWVGIDIAGDDNLTNFDLIFLVFDADNSGGWNAGDFFIKVPASSSNALINTGVQCNQSCGTKEYWQHDGASWQQVANVDTSIKARVAYDFEAAVDPEQKIWNVEIDMPVATMFDGVTRFNLVTAAPPFFRVGAYVFVDKDHLEQPTPQQGTVLRWPSTMVERTISQTNLFGIPSSQAAELAPASLTNVCFDVNFSVSDPWRINGFVANANDNRILRNAVNNFRVKYRFQGPDGAVGVLANPGKVRLSLTPFNASFWVPGNEFTKTKTLDVTPQNYDGEHTADFSWNFGAAAESWSAFEAAHGQVQFLCARLQLLDFQRDDNSSNNLMYVNHNEFTTSEYTHQVAFMGEAIPGLAAGQSATLRVRLQAWNDPTDKIDRGGVGFGPPLGGVPGGVIVVAALLAAMAGLAALAPGNRRRVGALGTGYALLAGAVALGGCQAVRRIVTGTPGRVELVNAAEIGLRPVPGDPGWYETRIGYREVKRLSLKFTGRPLPYRTVERRLPARDSAGGLNITRFPVRPGQVATVVAFGEVDLDGPNGPLPRTTPTGFSLAAVEQGAAAAGVAAVSRGLLLRPGYYTPADYAGALIGSFDNFEHSFVVGRSASVLVPPNANQLSLAVNAPRQGLPQLSGAFDLFVVTTQAPGVPTHTRTPGDATFQIPPTFDAWRILTSMNVYTYQFVDDRNPAGQVVGNTLRPLGAAHYSIYAVHDAR